MRICYDYTCLYRHKLIIISYVFTVIRIIKTNIQMSTSFRNLCVINIMNNKIKNKTMIKTKKCVYIL